MATEKTLEQIVDKNYKSLLDMFYSRYTENYCKNNQLYITYNKKKEVKTITRPLVDYADEIITTDYILIVGTRMHVVSDNKELEEMLNEFMDTADFANVLNLYILQGLILGDSFLKFSVDDDGIPTLSVPRLDEVHVLYVPDIDRVAKWILEYQAYNIEGKIVQVREEYTKDSIRIIVDDKIVKEATHDYNDFWLIHVINKPSLRYNIVGESELKVIYPTIDEINSTLSRMSAIEDIYAKPKLIASGMRDSQGLKQEDNLWALSDNAQISILEYKGDVLPSMLEKIKFLEDYLKSKNPELMLSHVRESTGYALRLKLLKLIKKIEAYRKNYFFGLKRALRLVAKYAGYDSDFDIVTDDIIPNDVLEDIQKFAQLMNMQIVSKRTVAERLGFDYDLEKQRMQDENELLQGEVEITVPNTSKRGNPGKTEVKKDETI